MTDDRVIEAVGTMTAEDLAEAWRLHGAKATRRFFMLDLALLAVGAAAWTWLPRGLGLVLTCTGVIGLGLHALSSHVLLPRRARQLFAQQKSLHGATHYRFDAEGVHVRADTGQATRPWSYYRRWREGPEIVVIYQSDILMEMLPKRWFADAHGVEALRRCLEASIAPVGALRRA